MKRRDRKAISAGIFISCTVVTHRMHRETAKMCRWQLYNNKLHATGWCKNGLRAIETLSSRNRKAEETSALRRSFLIFARCRTLVDQTPMARALGVVARARNMTALAREVGMSRVGLNKALSGEGNPTLSTVMKVAKALGLKVSIQPGA